MVPFGLGFILVYIISSNGFTPLSVSLTAFRRSFGWWKKRCVFNKDKIKQQIVLNKTNNWIHTSLRGCVRCSTDFDDSFPKFSSCFDDRNQLRFWLEFVVWDKLSWITAESLVLVELETGEMSPNEPTKMLSRHTPLMEDLRCGCGWDNGFEEVWRKIWSLAWSDATYHSDVSAGVKPVSSSGVSGQWYGDGRYLKKNLTGFKMVNGNQERENKCLVRDFF